MPRGGLRNPPGGRPPGARNGPETLPELRKKARVKAREEFFASEKLSAKRVLEELARLAFVDVSQLFNPDGSIRPINELPQDLKSALAGVEVVIKNAQAGDGHTDTVLKVKVWDKPRSLEMLAKHFKLLTDIVQHEGLDKIAERLADARKQHAGAS